MASQCCNDVLIFNFCFWFLWSHATGLHVLDCAYCDFVWLLDMAWNHIALSPAVPMLRMYVLVDELAGQVDKP